MKGLKEMKEEKNKGISIYPDGSGNSIQQLGRAEKEILERRQQCDLAEAFIDKHKDVLVGLSWDLHIGERVKIEAFCGSGGPAYRGKWIDPKELAYELFPYANWERVKDEFSDDYDYEALVDGVFVILTKAEMAPRKTTKKPKRTKLVRESV